jgi:hypothetical protein
VAATSEQENENKLTAMRKKRSTKSRFLNKENEPQSVTTPCLTISMGIASNTLGFTRHPAQKICSNVIRTLNRFCAEGVCLECQSPPHYAWITQLCGIQEGQWAIVDLKYKTTGCQVFRKLQHGPYNSQTLSLDNGVIAFRAIQLATSVRHGKQTIFEIL